ncbi:MAG: translocation/assembly module TamB domain-containing protein [Roseitalea sp.]|nr:translocation/assembly module TamB domain-containing protein [Roseitalea sp.]
MTGLFRIAALFCLLLGAVVTSALAQDAEERERSGFIRFVEEQISAPNMQIRLIGIEGSLSSDVSLERITISDDDGIWLAIEEPRLVWQRAALLRGRLVIDELSAASLDFLRPPLPDDSLPDPEAGGFSVPQLPVSVRIAELSLPRAAFGETVFGLQSVLSLAGSLSIDGAEMAADLDIDRLDGPGGSLDLDLTLQDETLDLQAALREPADGVVANLLNLQGRPPVALTLAGGGPLDSLGVDLGFDVDGARILDGQLATRRGFLAGATELTFSLGGPLADILPARERLFFGDETELAGRMRLDDDDGTRIDEITIASGALNGRVTGRLLRDGFPAQLGADIRLARPGGGPVSLPGAGDVTVGNARMTLDYGGTDWTARMELEALATPGLSIGSVGVGGSGTLSDLADPDTRAVSFALTGAARALEAADAALAEALGTTINADVRGQWRAGALLTLNGLTLAGETASIGGTGIIEGWAFDGTTVLEVADLSPFSSLLTRELAGAASLALDGSVALVGGGFDLVIDGGVSDLRIGDDLAGRLLAGDLALGGGVARTVEGLSFSALEAANDQLSLAVSGTLASETADLRAALSLVDLGLIDARSSGSAGIQVAVNRAPAPPSDTAPENEAERPYGVTASLLLPQGRLAGQPVSGMRLDFAGEAIEDRVAGRLDGGGDLAGQPVEIEAQVARDGTLYAVRDLLLEAGGGRLAGNLSYEDGLADGRLTVDASNIAGLAALALVEASGGLNADIELAARDGEQDVTATAALRSLTVAGVSVESGSLDATLTDVFGAMSGRAEADLRFVDVGGTVVRSASAVVRPVNGAETLGFEANATLEDGAVLDTQGTAAFGDVTRIGLDALSLDTRYGDARLAGPARIIVDGGTTRIEGLALNVEGGRVTAAGSVGEVFDLAVSFNGLPAGLANTVQPGLGAAGTISGRVDVTGPASDPRAAFAVNGEALTATVIRQTGVTPFSATISGTYRGQRITLSGLSARNGQGAAIDASGTVPLAGGALDMTASGTAPLELANAMLAGRGTRFSGTARFDARVGGALARPAVSGLVSVSGGRITDPGANIDLTGINLLAGLEGDRLVIRNASASLAGGGGLTLSGTVGLGAGLPADLTLVLAGARYSDGQLFSADLGADLTIAGPLGGGAVIAGVVDIARAEITVPETFAGDADLIDIRHVDPDAGTRATLERIAAVMPRADGGEPTAPYRLDVRINAPGQVFVRGRGLDAELGGQVRVTGPLNALAPVGAFNLIRGRLSLLARRLDFTNGAVTLTGNLDPFINMTAQTSSGDLTAFVTIVGPASDLDVQLSSSPSLPEDEILARILFGEDIGSLSPAQLTQLAAAAASLAGGGSDLAGGLRGALGVDDLDITQDEGGGVAVRAGRYLSDNVYLEVEAGADGAETSINLDVTESVTARGSATTSGDSSIGLFFERDY